MFLWKKRNTMESNNYNRDINVLEANAVLWWPESLTDKNANVSIIPNLLKSQTKFLSILNLSKESPFQIFDVLVASKFPVNLFLKHLSVLANYGGEPIQRLGRSFSDIFKQSDGTHKVFFSWEGENYEYEFESLPLRGLGNKKLLMDGEGLLVEQSELTSLFKDMIVILLFGSTSTVSQEAALSSCEVGTLLGKPDLLEDYVKKRYIMVSRITGGATSNSLGQLAQKEVVQFLKSSLGNSFTVVSNGTILLDEYDKAQGMPFDVVVTKNEKSVGIEISFQVTTNSTIERKAGQAQDRYRMIRNAGHHIAYILDGAGNFQRSSAISTICQNSECTVAYSNAEFEVLAEWISTLYD